MVGPPELLEELADVVELVARLQPELPRLDHEAFSDPRVLCPKHGRRAVRSTVIRNAFLGTMSVFGLKTLRHARDLVADAERRRVLTSREAQALRLASFGIPLGCLGVVVLLARYAV